MNTRQTILVSVAILLVGAVAVWWYLGFSLEFMRFFASESVGPTRSINPRPPRSSVVPRESPPPGCYYQDVECTGDIQAPCNPVLVCPSPAGGIVRCSPDTQKVAVNSGAQLSATGGSGTYQWFAPTGIIAVLDVIPGGTVLTNNFMVAYQTAGTKKVTVQSARGDGSNNVDLVACEVVVVPASQPQ